MSDTLVEFEMVPPNVTVVHQQKPPSDEAVPVYVDPEWEGIGPTMSFWSSILPRYR